MISENINQPVSFIFLIFLSISLCFADNNSVQQENADREFVVGVLYWSMNIPGQVAMRQGLEQEADRINNEAIHAGIAKVELIPNVAGDGIDGMENQIIQMKKMIELGVDLIIVQPTDIAALKDALQQANAAGIPVVAYDQHILGGELTSFITSDNYQAGFLDGEYVAANFPAEKKIRIVLVEYPHVSSTVSRVDGFIDALETYKQSFQIIKTYSAVEPIGGKKAGIQILNDFPDKGSIDVIFSVNDGGGLAVINELEAADRYEIFFASVDGDPVSVENIKRGGISRIDSAQFCGELGAEAMRISYQVLLGNEVKEEVLVPVFPITRETVDLYHGWSAPIPKPFKKPWYSNTPVWSGKPLNMDDQ
ncbi:MAG: sugar ABC transporter substrate-binding protein [Proteobacteria bacterium]|nr:sugar ABC transporter substrate-binding protein [Pseudomonadota bacterium]NOG61089.1 sugar ABC transporter substrate-binding protein [Pseudomonadota bacterium]